MKHVVLVLGLLGVAPAPTVESAPPEVKEVKILAHGAWPNVPVYTPAATPRELKQWIFRDEKALTGAAGPHGARTVAAALKVDAIDFKKQMLLAVFDGTRTVR